MDKQIIINTDNGGINLYESSIKGLEVFGRHLDLLNTWRNMVDQLENINPAVAKNFDFLTFKKLIDFDALLSVAITDLHIIISALYLSKIRLNKIFYIKHAYLVIYETHYNFEAKKGFIKQNASKGSLEISKTYDSVLKKWEKFIDDYKIKSDVKHVRNKIAGHIDKNFGIWYKTAVSLEAVYIANVVIAFLNIISEWQKLSSSLVILYKEKLDAMAIESNTRSQKMIDEMGVMIEKLNEKQPSDNKLEIDLSKLKNLLK